MTFSQTDILGSIMRVADLANQLERDTRKTFVEIRIDVLSDGIDSGNRCRFSDTELTCGTTALSRVKQFLGTPRVATHFFRVRTGASDDGDRWELVWRRLTPNVQIWTPFLDVVRSAATGGL